MKQLFALAFLGVAGFSIGWNLSSEKSTTVAAFKSPAVENSTSLAVVGDFYANRLELPMQTIVADAPKKASKPTKPTASAPLSFSEIPCSEWSDLNSSLSKVQMLCPETKTKSLKAASR